MEKIYAEGKGRRTKGRLNVRREIKYRKITQERNGRKQNENGSGKKQREKDRENIC